MRRILASLSVLAVSAAYIWTQGTLFRGAAETAASPPAPQQTAGTADVLRPAGPRMPDGTYTGDASAAHHYGDIIVEMQVVDGRIASLEASLYPDHQPISKRINVRALKKLYTETVETQARKMDYVTGATYTSKAFFRSLVSAMRKAQKQAS
jgi:uncharacterized protein with FMN-binding domain